ncbi:BCL-2-associated athanogene 6 [Carex rostrata]
MFPSNSYMDPYFSQNKEQIPHPSYPFYSYPVPNRPDPSAQSASYTPWPYQFNPTHSNGYFYPPGYYGPRPPFPYELPPPNFPNYYHPYFTPMLNYPTQYPQIDHTKSQTHCCGCPNHVCNGTHNPKVKIDEEKHDVDQRKIPNNAYPYFWFSPRNNVQQDEIEKQNEKREAQFPWPIVWMPEDEVKEKEKKDTQIPWPLTWMPEEDAKETKIIPLKFLEHGDKDQTEMPKFPVVEKKQGVKRIPVMEKKDGSEKVGKEQPVKESTRDKTMEKKLSKLPPVCLRVDPPSHKKPTNGSSKENKNKKEVKVVEVKGAKDERKEREIEVNKGLKEERKIDDVRRVSMPKEDKIKKEIKVADVRGAEGKELKERDIQGEDLKEKMEERKVVSVKRSKISEQDAAVLIQSVYRGYNVRRWDPLEKLKKIRSVHEKAQELMGRMQNVEESAIQLEKKELLVLGETIMNLLLQLDTIQGLHPTVREARKSVARELVSLQEKLDSLEKLKAVETQANEAQQPQLEVQPTASTVSSDSCKLASEQVDLQSSEAPTMECVMTQKEDEKAQSATDFHPIEEILVKNEDDACSAPESQVTPFLGDTEPTDLLPETIAGENNLDALNAQSPQTENVELHATEVVPSIAIEGNTTELTPAVTSFESSTDASHVLSESMHDTAVTSSGTEDIHDKEVAPRVAVNEGVNQAAIIPETNNLGEDGYVEEIQIRATENDARKEIAPEVESEAVAKEVDSKEAVVAQEESHGRDTGASVENFELPAIEDGKPSNKESKVEDNEIAPDSAVTASPEAKVHVTEVLPEVGYVNEDGASAEKVELLATEVDKSVENKSMVPDEVTALPENEVTSLPENENPDGFQKMEELNELQAEVHSNLVQTDAMEVAPEVTSTDDATEVSKLGWKENKLVEENEKLRDMLEKLLEAGRNQLDVISGLNERVKGLEKRLERKSKKSKVRVKKQHKPAMTS